LGNGISSGRAAFLNANSGAGLLVTLIQGGHLGYFMHIPITTPFVSTLKKLLYPEFSRSSNGHCILNHFWLLGLNGGFHFRDCRAAVLRIEMAVTKPFRK
jgi:hypothetical protein